jgi:threonine dehydrogenase-like Zn-dependent dehydrogenase
MHDYGEDLRVETVPLPEVEPGAILTEVDAVTLCGSDVHIWEGALEGVLPISLPLILGHEVVGRVVALGARAEHDSVGVPLEAGDRVVWEHESCHECHVCTITGEPNLCPNRHVGMLSDCTQPPYVVGGFSEYSYVWPKSRRLRVPDELPSDWAGAASCALRTVIRAFDRLGAVDHSDTVVIQGAGPLGLFGTAIAATKSPKKIIVIGAPEQRLEIARSFGADLTISIEEHPDPEERRQLVLEASGGRGAEVAFEFSGAPNAFAEGIHLVAPAGRYVIVGTVSGEPQPVLAHRITNSELTVIGSFGSTIESYHKAMNFMLTQRDRFDWNLMLGKHYGLDGATEALRAMKAGRETKPVIVPALTKEQ